VSYRRTDSDAAAGRLHRDFAEYFGTKRVFMDVHGIAPSQAWDKAIEDAIRGCKAGVVIIGSRWMTTLLSSTKAGLSNEIDFLRREIAMLLNGDKAIAPVLVEGASLPDKSGLPAELSPLLSFQAPMLNNANWDVVIAQLIQQLERAIRTT
jgi:TIR domain